MPSYTFKTYLTRTSTPLRLRRMHKSNIIVTCYRHCLSRWSRGLRHGFAAVLPWRLELAVSVARCWVECCPTDCSLVQSSPTERGMSKWALSWNLDNEEILAHKRRRIIQKQEMHILYYPRDNSQFILNKIPTRLYLTETNTYSLFQLLFKHPVPLNIPYLYMLISAKAVYARSETSVSRGTRDSDVTRAVRYLQGLTV
jgi:hypothetical protein